ncbi:MAG: flagellar motor switch protein [Alphaproteobacteria bacterium]|nr:MAG: flagellar motor switch protein [Alphaproteobacteria bacterium]
MQPQPAESEGKLDAGSEAAPIKTGARVGREEAKSVEALLGVRLDVRVVLGRRRLPISELLEFTKGSVVELDRRVGDPVDIMINDRLVARGDLVKVNGDLIGVAIREVLKDVVLTD